ncbi:hypothetical protein V6Z11_A01G070600 [Gossypium hirsutum]
MPHNLPIKSPCASVFRFIIHPLYRLSFSFFNINFGFLFSSTVVRVTQVKFIFDTITEHYATRKAKFPPPLNRFRQCHNCMTLSHVMDSTNC